MERLQTRSELRAHKRLVRLGAENLLPDGGRQPHFDTRVTFTITSSASVTAVTQSSSPLALFL